MIQWLSNSPHGLLWGIAFFYSVCSGMSDPD